MWTLLCAPALAVDWTVPVDAPTITAAVNLASAGDRILLEPGTYAEAVDVFTDLTFVGGPGVVWRGDVGSALEIDGVSAVTVTDVMFDGEGANRGVRVRAGSSATIERCLFYDGEGSAGGGVRAEGAVELWVSESTFIGNTADDGGQLFAANTDFVRVESCVFVEGYAVSDGGGLLTEESDTVEIVDSWFVDNATGDDGGAVSVDRSTQLLMMTSLFCDNTIPEFGGAAELQDNLTNVLQNNLFVANTSTTGAGAIHVRNSGSLVTVNNDFVGNVSTVDGVAVRGAGNHVSTNDLFAFNLGGNAHREVNALVSHAVFYDNDGNSNAVLDGSVLFTDPVIPDPLSCDPVDHIPGLGSSTIDAGDPLLLDSDGTTSDIGAFGGSTPIPTDRPGVPDPDADLDWFPASSDCDDTDPDVSPAAPEVLCNGTNDDCDTATADAPDEDGDNTTVCDGDCNDLDSTISPGAQEIVADGVDQDCDGAEVCWIDTDGDGRGEMGQVLSTDDLACTGAGEAPALDDVCLGFDDTVDPDGDGVPVGCDPCPLDIADDSDGDGSCDSDDRCPGFDDFEDSDDDQVADGCDLCPGFDDGIDVDEDDVPDDCDACIGEDSDADGVCDTDDVCPGFDDGVDTDADGVADGCDPCPLDPLDDSDADGVCDSDDACPGTDDAAGCADSDGDGVPDAIDPFPFDDGADGVVAPPEAPGCATVGGAPIPFGVGWIALLAFRRRRP